MPKHPRQPRMQGASEYKNIGSRTKQPRPLEDGNWVCEDQDCNNVNYPRRTLCHKCGKKRGPIGDAVVKGYFESFRPMQHYQGVKMAHPMHPDRMAMTLGMFPVLHNGLQVHQYGMAPTELNCIRDFDPWREEAFEKQAHIRQQYLPPYRSFPGRGSFISVATEGKRLAEHLVASFAASSSDPLGDSGECLASATLWLQKMKCGLKDYQNSNARIPASPLMSTPSTTFEGIPLSVEVTERAESMVSQKHGNSTPMMAPHSALKIGNITVGPRAKQCAYLTWEDFKDQKIDYKKELNHTIVKTTLDIDRNPRPDQQGDNCSWECENCRNVNLSERNSCIHCNNSRSDPEGEDIVTKYVDSLLADSEDDVQHL